MAQGRATRTTAIRSLAIVATLLMLLAGVARAQGASPSEGVSDPHALLVATLLDDTDLPGFTGRDLGDPSDLDIDRLAFDEQRGIERVARAWVSQDQGVVFDQRMRFPTAEAALAYLMAAEPTLSEADDAGLSLVTDDPLTPATRHWAGETVISAEPVAMDVWLIPVGPVIAKVAATVFGPALEGRRGFAERALERLEAAYGPATATSPWSSPGASPDASSTSDIRIVERLVQRVLRTGQRGCESLEPGLPGEVTALSCARGEAIVVYRAFSDLAARDAAFASLIDQVTQPLPTTSSCADGAARGDISELDRSWSMACWDSSSGRVLLWTEPDDAVLGAILAPASVDVMSLWQGVRFVAE